MSLSSFIDRFGGMTEEYLFYNGEIVLRYDPKDHIYLLVTQDGLEPQSGVTNTCHIIDKSEALVPWACKQMAEKLLTEAVVTLPDGTKIVRQMSYQDFENLVLAAKTAHRDAVEKSGEIGHIAHAWIEQYIKAVIAKNQPRIEELLAKFPADERATNCCHAALDWMSNHNIQWIGTERKIYSRRHKYAGTMDGLCLADSCDDPRCCHSPFKSRLTIIDWKTSNYLYPEYRLQTAAYEQAYEEETGEKVEDRWIIRLGKEDAEFDPWHMAEGDFETDWNGFRLALELGRQMDLVKISVKTFSDLKAAHKKEQKRYEREQLLRIKCVKADRYKGFRYPKCNDNGEPCETCLHKYKERNGTI